MLATASHFHPYLVFADKTIEALHFWGSTLESSSLVRKYLTRVDMANIVKRPSLLRNGINGACFCCMPLACVCTAKQALTNELAYYNES